MNKKKRIVEGPRASEAFIGILEGGGATTVTCSFCDREHIAIDSSNVIDGFVTSLCESVADIEASAKADPDSYVIVRDVDFIHYSMINGMAYPDDCPCNGLAPYEKFIWENRERWFSYYAIRKLQILDDLESLSCVKT